MPRTSAEVRTPEQVKAVADEMRALAARLDLAADRMSKHGFQELLISAADSLDKGIDKLRAFASAVDADITKERRASGHFGRKTTKRKTPPKKDGK